jgi:hypothetical protein
LIFRLPFKILFFLPFILFFFSQYIVQADLKLMLPFPWLPEGLCYRNVPPFLSLIHFKILCWFINFIIKIKLFPVTSLFCFISLNVFSLHGEWSSNFTFLCEVLYVQTPATSFVPFYFIPCLPCWNRYSSSFLSMSDTSCLRALIVMIILNCQPASSCLCEGTSFLPLMFLIFFKRPSEGPSWHLPEEFLTSPR